MSEITIKCNFCGIKNEYHINDYGEIRCSICGHYLGNVDDL